MKKKMLTIALLSSVSGVAFAVSQGGYVHAPEINPASIGSALTLLIGGLTVLKSRFSRK